MEMNLKLSRLTQEEFRKLAELVRVKHVNLDELIETQLLAWLRSTEKKFSDAGQCPSCSLRSMVSELKGMPVLEAEKEGLITIGVSTDRTLLKNTNYVICPRCLWWGIPEKK